MTFDEWYESNKESLTQVSLETKLRRAFSFHELNYDCALHEIAQWEDIVKRMKAERDAK